MKRYLLLTILLCISALVYSQTTNTFPATGYVGIGTTSPTKTLDVIGDFKSNKVYTDVLQLNECYFEKVFYNAINFNNGVSNSAVDIRFGNISVWGYIEIEINSTYSYQNSTGKLTKIFTIGTNPNNLIYNNSSRVSDAIGTIQENISIGEFAWDATNSTYKIPISHIVPTGNVYTVKVKVFSGSSGAASTLEHLTISDKYTLAALSKNYVCYVENVGIGTQTPFAKITIPSGTGYNGMFGIEAASSSDSRRWWIHTDYQVYGDFSISTETTKQQGSNPNLSRLYIKSDGNVGIGTINPTAKLAVNGVIKAKEVKVTIETVDWPDFVFNTNRKLRSLGELEQFIKANNHLPEIPTEKEVKENGVGLGEMNAKLLQKVEELTLYMIEQQKRITELEKRVEKIDNK